MKFGIQDIFDAKNSKIVEITLFPLYAQIQPKYINNYEAFFLSPIFRTEGYSV